MHKSLSRALVLSSVLVAGFASANDYPVVQSSSGYVAGSTSNGASTRIAAFKGIPYAAPPVGPLRWRDPQPVRNWNGVKNATNFGKACYQPDASFDVLEVGEQSEDCLYLNVWSPTQALTASASKRPVLFFIHGGSYSSGAGHIYPGDKLAQQDIVVVTFNYRLGTFGFATHRDLHEGSQDGMSGNYGLEDQVAALKWVKTNIAQFGGDPNRITIAGQSAGASSVAYMMTSPSTRGLFQGAILQSGYASNAEKNIEAAEKKGDKLATLLLCDVSALSSVDCLRGVSAKNILASAKAVGFGPIVDGTLIPESPAAVFARGEQAQVPILLGQTKDEGNIFTRSLPIYFVWQYKSALKDMFGDFSDRVFDAFPASYFGEVGAALGRVATASSYTAPVRRFMRTLDTGHTKPVYQYYLTRLSGYAKDQGMGVFHGNDLFYLFGWMQGRQGFDSTDRMLESALLSAFGSFVKTGDPESNTLRRIAGVTNSTDRLWNRHQMPAQANLEFGDNIRSGNDICSTSKASCDLFDEIEAHEEEKEIN